MAYGARLESVLGASPRGFESPLLRQSESAASARRLLRASAHSSAQCGDLPPGLGFTQGQRVQPTAMNARRRSSGVVVRGRVPVRSAPISSTDDSTEY